MTPGKKASLIINEESVKDVEVSEIEEGCAPRDDDGDGIGDPRVRSPMQGDDSNPRVRSPMQGDDSALHLSR